MTESRDNIKVVIRIRPLNSKELRESTTKNCVAVNELKNQVLIDSRPDPKTFSYDYVAPEMVTQDEIFENVGKSIINYCLSGYNASVFAYGQTGAGKTYTIQGPGIDTMGFGLEENFEQRGLLPRCFEYIFSEIGRLRHENPNLEFLVKCSYLEIYQEQVIDLLAGNNSVLQLREDIKSGVYVENLGEEVVRNTKDTYELLKQGAQNRHVGATSMNKESSRSHSVFTMMLESKETNDGLISYKMSRFHIIDLAGSERQKATDTAGGRLKEAGMINKSLSALGNVINSLVDISEGKSRYVHYRDSKLTFLLKDSLGGNAKTCMIACISPSNMVFGETLSTLKFAQRAKLIKNKAVVNQDTTGTMNLLREEVKRLKEELEQAKAIADLALYQCPKCDQKLRQTQETLESNERVIQLEMLLEQNLRLLKIQDQRHRVLIEDKQNYISSLLGQVEKLEQGLGVPKNLQKVFAEREDLKIMLERMTMEINSQPGSEKHLIVETIEFTQILADVLKTVAKERERLREVWDEYQQLKEGQGCHEESQRITALTAALNQERKQREELQRILDKRNNTQVNQSDQIETNLKLAELEINSLNDEKQEYIKQVDKYRVQMQIMSNELQALRKQDQENNIIQNASAEKEQKFNEILSEFETKLEEYEYQKFQIEELGNLLKDSETIINNKEQEINELIQFGIAQVYLNSSLQNQSSDQSSQLLVQISVLQSELQNSQSKSKENIEALNQDLLRQQEYIHQLQIQNRQIEAQLQRIQEQNQDKQNLLKQYQCQCDELKQENLQILKQEQALKYENQGLKDQVVQWEKNYQQLIQNHRDYSIEDDLENITKPIKQQISSQRQYIEEIQGDLDHYQQLSINLSQRNAELIGQIATLQETSIQSQNDSLNSSLMSELELARDKINQLEEENITKMKILQKTNQNIITTRNEISVWKKCIEEKNITIQNLRKELKQKEDRLSALQLNSSGSEYQEEMMYMKQLIKLKDKEIIEFKERGQQYYVQAEDAIGQQRKELELMSKRCHHLQNELAQAKKQISDAQCFNQTFNVMNSGEKSRHKGLRDKLKRYKQENQKLINQIDSIKRVSDSGDDLQQYKRQIVLKNEEITRLTQNLTEITDYILNLPTVQLDPNKDIVESTIQAVNEIYTQLHYNQQQIQKKNQQLTNKTSMLSLIENEQSL